MNYRAALFLLIAILLGTARAEAQQAISFEDLAKRIDPYFAPELVADVKAALPPNAIDVWGGDVGDFTNDGANDLIIAFRNRGDGRRRMNIYMFVDDQGMLLPVKQSVVEFVELPMEVGVSIYEGNAIMTRKITEDHWERLGYRYRDGVVMLVEKFVTERQGLLTYESKRNYQTLEGQERYINSNDGTEVFRSEFLTTPSYNRGRDVSSGYQATAEAQMSKYILRGSYYWKNEKDLTLYTRSAFDNDYLYLNIIVRDDEAIPSGLNGIDTTADRLELWLDMYSLGDRFRVSRRTRDFRMKTDSNIYAFNITLGDFIDQPAKLKIASSNTLDESQMAATKQIKAVALKSDTGYVVKLRLPFALFGFVAPPLDERGITPFGMNVVVHDVDNPYRPEETTTLTTSQSFDRTKPATFGAVALVPTALYYGESVNVFLGDIKERLEEVGF